tara:strand:- start:183 stop:293 length:111 start_codon:yes stop_codon:yes gene_type:complete
LFGHALVPIEILIGEFDSFRDDLMDHQRRKKNLSHS